MRMKIESTQMLFKSLVFMSTLRYNFVESVLQLLWEHITKRDLPYISLKIDFEILAISSLPFLTRHSDRTNKPEDSSWAPTIVYHRATQNEQISSIVLVDLTHCRLSSLSEHATSLLARHIARQSCSRANRHYDILELIIKRAFLLFIFQVRQVAGWGRKSSLGLCTGRLEGGTSQPSTVILSQEFEDLLSK